jgi:hypothetical protein
MAAIYKGLQHSLAVGYDVSAITQNRHTESQESLNSIESDIDNEKIIDASRVTDYPIHQIIITNIKKNRKEMIITLPDKSGEVFQDFSNYILENRFSKHNYREKIKEYIKRDPETKNTIDEIEKANIHIICIECALEPGKRKEYYQVLADKNTERLDELQKDYQNKIRGGEALFLSKDFKQWNTKEEDWEIVCNLERFLKGILFAISDSKSTKKVILALTKSELNPYLRGKNCFGPDVKQVCTRIFGHTYTSHFVTLQRLRPKKYVIELTNPWNVRTWDLDTPSGIPVPKGLSFNRTSVDEIVKTILHAGGII